MGEYATYGNERIKIGTCENMYYLRADQAERVRALEGNVDPLRDASGIRFRFPFPDEDTNAPGDFDDPFRGLPVYVDPLPVFDHSSVQFTASVGYLCSLPCPESPEGQALVKLLPFGMHKNGWRGGTARIVQQRVWDGTLALVAACAGCDAKYRLPTLEDAEPYVLACRAEADRLADRLVGEARAAKFWQTVADRITAGYTDPPAWVRRPDHTGPTPPEPCPTCEERAEVTP